MTGGGSEEARAAREVLRAARERGASASPGSGASGVSGEEPAQADRVSPGDRTPRPSDAAREALHRALRERRGVSAAPDGADAGDTGAAPDAGDGGADGTPTSAPRPKGADGEGADPADRDEASDSTEDSEAAGGPSSRPGDIAREALRAAREERARARAREQVEEAKRPRRDPAPRVPRTTRGDRAADRRAREIRESLADAFLMPDTTDAPTPAASTETDTSPTSAGASTRSRVTPPHAGATGTTAQPAVAPPPAAQPPAAQPPAAPPSMAAPARDGDHRRTFPPFPPRSSGDDGPFAETWWGRAWVTALEDGALDPARLARGRGYAEQGHVDAITVTPGLVLAYVQGSRPRPYRVQVRLRTFDDADWDRFLDAAADRPGHIAALLDKEMPQSLADCGVPLLPGPGDLAPRCSCPDSGHPCKHAAALCYQTARLLDADPFVLLLLRGRGEREVIDALSRLSAARAARAAQGREPEPLPGIRATDAVSRRGPELPPPPTPLPPPSHPEQPPVYPASPGGPDPFALDQLATDAAARAHALLTTGRDPVGGLSVWHDAVRLAAARPGSGLTAGTRALYASLARAAGRTPGDLARAVAAWRQGGPTGLSVLEEPWDPPAGRFDRARPLLLAADFPAFRPWRNRLTHPRGHVQLRLGRDHLWYAYESEPGQDDWWPRGTPDPDPVGALTGLDTVGDA
ncbi:SWIM zinc finger family protein [Streptomyces pseudogriseolus]|uniref:SWIM zinc finger family protein n=1 Tax=Streptomyces pseudogriseolus TaxID=36817 RepID=UPI003FA1B405